MFDKTLVLSILGQINGALETIANRAKPIRSSDDFTGSLSGMEKLDSICMLFMAIGEALKNIDKLPTAHFFRSIPRSTGRAPLALET